MKPSEETPQGINTERGRVAHQDLYPYWRSVEEPQLRPFIQASNTVAGISGELLLRLSVASSGLQENQPQVKTSEPRPRRDKSPKTESR